MLMKAKQPSNASTSPRYYHAIFPGNPHKGGVINVSTDVPRLPISQRTVKGTCKAL
jgi:hypothetical protein